MCSKGYTVRTFGGLLTLFVLTISLGLSGCSANDLEKMIGRWYVIGASASNDEGYYRCVSLNITKVGINVVFIFTGLNLLTGESLTYTGMIRPGKDNRAWWWVQDRENEIDGSFIPTIIEEEGSVVLILDDIMNQGRRLRKSGVILSKMKRVDDTLWTKLREKFIPHLNNTDTYYVLQAKCELRLTCKVERQR